MTALRLGLAFFLIVLGSTAARAHHIQGKIVCDVGNTPLNGVEVKVTALSDPGMTMRFDKTGDNTPSGNDGPGNYYVGLPTESGDYKVELTMMGLPVGSSIISPAGGTYLVHIITGNADTNHKDDADFIVTNCGTTTTTTSSSTSSTTTGTATTTTTTTTTTGSTGSSSSSTSTSTSSSTTTTVCIPTAEDCDNGKDDDCDLLIDCVDQLDCSPRVPPCRIGSDPSRIRFGSRSGRDLFRSHGRVKLRAPVDPATAKVGWMLSNSSGMIFQADLQPGTLVDMGQQFRFRDSAVMLGQDEGARSGIWYARIFVTHRGWAYYWVRAYGDFSRATEPTMTIQLHIDDQWFGVTGLWNQRPRGWVFFGRELPADGLSGELPAE